VTRSPVELESFFRNGLVGTGPARSLVGPRRRFAELLYVPGQPYSKFPPPPSQVCLLTGRCAMRALDYCVIMCAPMCHRLKSHSPNSGRNGQSCASRQRAMTSAQLFAYIRRGPHSTSLPLLLPGTPLVDGQIHACAYALYLVDDPPHFGPRHLVPTPLAGPIAVIESR
jgi:hypothetical protein